MLGWGAQERHERETVDKQMRMKQDEMGLGAVQAFSGGFDREEMRDILSYTLDNDNILEKFEKQLRGYQLEQKVDPKSGQLIQQWVKSGDAFMRENKGITDYIGFISGLIGKNAIMSAFDEKDMKIFLKNVGRNIIVWCQNNHTRYGIDSLKAMPVINRTIDIIELSVRRSLAGKERSYGYGAVPKEVRYGQYGGSDEKTRFFGGIR